MAAPSKPSNLRGRSRRENVAPSLLDPPTASLFMPDNVPTLWMPSSPAPPAEPPAGAVIQSSDVTPHKPGLQRHSPDTTPTHSNQKQQKASPNSPQAFNAGLFSQSQQTTTTTTTDPFASVGVTTPIQPPTTTDDTGCVGHATTFVEASDEVNIGSNQPNLSTGSRPISSASSTSTTEVPPPPTTQDVSLDSLPYEHPPPPSYSELSTSGLGGYTEPPPPYPTAEHPSGQRNVLEDVCSDVVSFGRYEPVSAHWFYSKTVEETQVWLPFSIKDSIKLEDVYNTSGDPNVVIATDGGRYDVVLFQRTRYAVYWEEKPSEVRRCTWFYKRSQFENVFLPYDESFSARLEMEFRSALISNSWHRRIDLNSSEAIVMHNPNVLVHFISMTGYDSWGNPVEEHTRFRTLKRGIDTSFNISQGEEDQIDHLVFVVHGIGPVADLRFRDLVECVNDFRYTSGTLMKTHFSDRQESGRVEFLPVSWHHILHSDATGVDSRMKSITLPSIGRLRHFINETLLDILFYTSPVYCQTISDTVCSDMNRLYDLFISRNPSFSGSVSTAGHSLGAVILFDLLAHQGESSLPTPSKVAQNVPGVNTGRPSTPNTGRPSTPNSGRPSTPNTGRPSTPNTGSRPVQSSALDDILEQLGLTHFREVLDKEQIDLETLKLCQDDDLKELGIPMGPRKKLLCHVTQLKDTFLHNLPQSGSDQPATISPSSDSTTDPTTHPDQSNTDQAEAAGGAVPPHASLSVDFTPGLAGTGQPMVRYSQLAFKPTALFALGSPIGMFLTVRGINDVGIGYQLPTCPAFYNIYHPYDPVAYRIEPIVNADYVHVKPVLMPHHKGRKRLHLELKDSISRVGADLKRGLIRSMKSTVHALQDLAFSKTPNPVSSGDQASPGLASNRPGPPPPTPDDTENYVFTGVSDILTDSNTVDEEEIKEDDFVEVSKADVTVGSLNGGRRIDYVLQEKTFESLNEYLFAMATHLSYWESEDTALMVLQQIYSLSDVIRSTDANQ